MVETELKEAQEKLEVLKKEMKILLLPKTPMMRETLLLKSEAVPGEMRLPCLPEICSGCIPGMPREMGGNGNT